MMTVKIQLRIVALVLVAAFGAIAARAEPFAGGGRTTHVTSTAPAAGMLIAVAVNLCGRGLSGRCTKGRAACTYGTAADCARWTRWSQACSACADAFAACRQRVGHSARYTCDRCLAAHDACEAKMH